MRDLVQLAELMNIGYLKKKNLFLNTIFSHISHNIDIDLMNELCE